MIEEKRVTHRDTIKDQLEVLKKEIAKIEEVLKDETKVIPWFSIERMHRAIISISFDSGIVCKQTKN